MSGTADDFEEPTQFVEKVFRLSSDPQAIWSFSDNELVLLLQLMIKGHYLNKELIIQFNLNKELENYIEHFQLLSDKPEFFEDVRQDLQDLLSADPKYFEIHKNSFSDIIDKFVKWLIRN